MIHGLKYQLNEAGKIKIGMKGAEIKSAKGNSFRPPVKYDHFEITTTEKDKNGDWIIDTPLIERIKKNGGIVNENGDLIGIPIRFLYNDPDLNFKTELVSYDGKHLSCKGDGKVSRKRVSDFESDHDCPCKRIEPDYTGKNKCKYFGTLTCIIDEAELLGQAHKFRTTSKNSVRGILGGIELIKTATGGGLAGLPLMLTLNPKTTTIPGGGTTTVYVVSICYRGSMADLRADALAMAQEQSQYRLNIGDIEAQIKALPAPRPTEEDQADVAAEFFPDIMEGEILKETTIPTETEEPPETLPPEKPEEKKEEDAPGSSVAGTGEPSIIGLPPEGALYTDIYNRFIEESDCGKAIALMRRLKKENILYWLSIHHENVKLDPSQKKPEIVTLAENVLRETMEGGDTQETPQEDPKEKSSGEDQGGDAGHVSEKDWGSQEVAGEPEKKKTGPPKHPREWDNSGPISPDQCRKLVGLREGLIKAKMLGPDIESWVRNVNYFLDQAGEPISSAKNLTRVQGDNLISILEYNLENIPF